MRLLDTLLSDPSRKAETSIAVSHRRAPERSSTSSLPPASSSSTRPSVQRTLCFVLLPSRVFSTICRYRRSPDGLMRKNMAVPLGETPHIDQIRQQIAMKIRIDTKTWHRKIGQDWRKNPLTH